jgi:hypothetical protein
MLSANEESRFFDDCRPALLEHYSGQFAVVCGKRLLGVHASLELALQSAADAFSQGLLQDGAPILIDEIGAVPRVRVVAEPKRVVRPRGDDR